MKLYTEEDLIKAIAFGFGVCRKEDRAPFNTEMIEFIGSLEPTKHIKLPTDEELQLMSEQHAACCGLQNFFDEDEIMVTRHHWIKGYEKAIKDFLTYGGNK